MRRLIIMAAVATIFLTISFHDLMAGEVMDEQFGPGGSKVELVKAKVRNDVLTIAVRYVHPYETMTAEEQNQLRGKNWRREADIKSRQIPIKFKVSSVFYVANGKKYHVLKDKNGNWLASPVVGDYVAEPVDIKSVKRHLRKGEVPALILDANHPVKILWFKFPAPPEGVQGIEFQIPEVAPFDVEIK